MSVSGLAVAKIAQLQLPEQVSERLRGLILECKLPPGARLVERDLADLLGVSRTPIREALFQLKREGFVSAPEGRGLFVSALSEIEIIEIYQAIAALERAALRHMPDVPAAIISDLVAARERQSARRGDPVGMIAADLAWHEALTRRCTNEKVLEMLRPLRTLSLRYERAFFGEAANLLRSVSEHEAIECLIGEGDLARVSDAIEAHWLGNIGPMRAVVAAAGKGAGRSVRTAA